MLTTLGLFFATCIKLLALMTPPAVLSAFLSGTREYDMRRKRRTALRTGMAVFITAMVLYFFGEYIFDVFGFTLDAFRIGAGSLLFLNAVSLMDDKKPAAHAENHTNIDVSEDISVVPLAIPLCMGPASIGTVMVMGASAHTLETRLVGAAALLVASTGITLMLFMSTRLERVLRRTGIAVMSKLTGLILAAIAAQVVFTGLRAFLKG